MKVSKLHFGGSVTKEFSLVMDSYRCCRRHLYASNNLEACVTALNDNALNPNGSFD